MCRPLLDASSSLLAPVKVNVYCEQINICI